MNLQVSRQEGDKTFYDEIIRTCKGVSNYRADEFYFDNLEGYWQSKTELVIGQSYKLWLTTKPKGGTAKPGSLYRDIRSAELVEGYVPRDQPEYDEDGPVGWNPNEPPYPAEAPKRVINVYDLGMAFNQACTLYASEGGGISLDGTFPEIIRRIRDRLLYEVILVPPEPPDSGGSEDEEGYLEVHDPTNDNTNWLLVSNGPEAPIVRSGAVDWGGVAPHPQGQGKFCPLHEMSELGPQGTHWYTDKGQRVECKRGQHA